MNLFLIFHLLKFSVSTHFSDSSLLPLPYLLHRHLNWSLAAECSKPGYGISRYLWSTLWQFDHLFTDGSKAKEPNPVGLSIYSPTLSLNLKFKILKEASVYTAEALAILITLKFIKSHRTTNSFIYSDSLSTLMAAASLRFFLATFPR